MVIEETSFLPIDTYAFLGGKLAVRSNSPEVLRYLRSLYGRFCAQPGSPHPSHPSDRQAPHLELEVVDRMAVAQELSVRDTFGSYTISCKDLHSPSADGHSADGVLHPLGYVERSFLRNLSFLAGDYDFLHAAAVSWKNVGLIFPGFSGHGKTTICLKLVAQGFKFLSDEIACLHREHGIVEPFPRLARLDQRSLELLAIPASRAVRSTPADGEEAEWLLDIGVVFPSAYGGPAKLRYTIFLQGFAEETRLEPVAQTRALFALFKSGLRRPDNVPAGLFGFAPFLDEIRSFDLVIGDLEEAATMISGLVRSARD